MEGGVEDGQILAMVPYEPPGGVGLVANAFEPGAFVPEDH